MSRLPSVTPSTESSSLLLGLKPCMSRCSGPGRIQSDVVLNRGALDCEITDLQELVRLSGQGRDREDRGTALTVASLRERCSIRSGKDQRIRHVKVRHAGLLLELLSFSFDGDVTARLATFDGEAARCETSSDARSDEDVPDNFRIEVLNVNFQKELCDKPLLARRTRMGVCETSSWASAMRARSNSKRDWAMHSLKSANGTLWDIWDTDRGCTQ